MQYLLLNDFFPHNQLNSIHSFVWKAIMRYFTHTALQEFSEVHKQRVARSTSGLGTNCCYLCRVLTSIETIKSNIQPQRPQLSLEDNNRVELSNTTLQEHSSLSAPSGAASATTSETPGSDIELCNLSHSPDLSASIPATSIEALPCQPILCLPVKAHCKANRQPTAPLNLLPPLNHNPQPQRTPT